MNFADNNGGGGGGGGGNAVEIWNNLICKPRHERTGRELFQMSLDERTEVYSDLGGAQQINPENPDFVNQCLIELDETIANIRSKHAYDIAQQMSPEYVNSKRLMFLRADNFNVVKCANRMIRHYQEKLDLWGSGNLNKDITLNCLSEDDMECLQGGGFQFLPQCDQFGRLVLCSRQVEWKYKHRENMLHALWYMCMSCVEEESVQRRGIVGLGYSVGDVTGWSSDYELVRRIVGMLSALPIRMLAIYTCFNSNRIESAVDVVVHMFNSFLRARFRAILGTRQECNYQLMLMGIKPADVPVSDDGKLLVDNHMKWLQKRFEIESQRRAAEDADQMDMGE